MEEPEHMLNSETHDTYKMQEFEFVAVKQEQLDSSGDEELPATQDFECITVKEERWEDISDHEEMEAAEVSDEPEQLQKLLEVVVKEEQHQPRADSSVDACDPLCVKEEAFIPAGQRTRNNRLNENDGRGCGFLPSATDWTGEVYEQPGLYNHNSVLQEGSKCDRRQLQAGMYHGGGRVSSNIHNCVIGNNEPFAATCSSCSESFTSKYNLINHVFTHSGGVLPPSRICKLCGEVFASETWINEVSVSDWNKQNSGFTERRRYTSPAAGQWFCGKCHKAFSSRDCFMAHLQENTEGSCLCLDRDCTVKKRKCIIPAYNLYRNASENVTRSNVVPNGRKKLHAGDRRYACNLCNKAYNHASSLRQHERSHTGEKPYTCKICCKSFTASGTLSKHLRLHTGVRPYTCEECNKSFNYAGALKQHQRVHTGEKPYVCGVCDKAFSQYTSLKTHKRLHTGEKPYECNFCGKTFRQPGTFKEHRRMHTGEKPFACKFCSKTFSRSAHLKIHERIHTGEKPYTCNICNKVFSQSCHLKTHKRLHTE